MKGGSLQTRRQGGDVRLILGWKGSRVFRSSYDTRLIQNYENINVFTESRLLSSQSTHHFSRHDGFLATREGRYSLMTNIESGGFVEILLGRD